MFIFNFNGVFLSLFVQPPRMKTENSETKKKESPFVQQNPVIVFLSPARRRGKRGAQAARRSREMKKSLMCFLERVAGSFTGRVRN